MTTLRLDSVVMPSAALGAENPLPPLGPPGDLHQVEADEGADPELRAGLAYGRAHTILPYLVQDGYTREQAPREHPVAVLENDRVRAVFLLAQGGRLYSLTDRRTGRELLHRNPVFQPANLALRNAWFAGGVEWNLGTTGHWPMTCAPLHAVRVQRADGEVGLRLYEFERMRGLVMRIDASLAPDAALLTVRITIVNPGAREAPVYWWSNIAVPEREDVRVLAPAHRAWYFGRERRLTTVPFPRRDGLDRSYTTRAVEAADYFLDLGGRPLPWIAALDGTGAGLFQASTARLRGRKLFLWGTGSGSTHWQNWLSDGVGRYLEIQAGLARTQLEHLPLPAGESWSWVEAYGLAEASAGAVHGQDWGAAVAEVERAVRATGAAHALQREAARDDAGDRLAEVLHHGSGWGALENLRRAAAGEPALPEATPFPAATLGAGQEYWRVLLERGPAAATPAEPGAAPLSYQTEEWWLPRLAERDTWEAHLHAGVIHAASGVGAAALQSWRASIERADNGWAHRAIAATVAAAAADGGSAEAAAEYRAAHRLLPGVPQLSVEATAALIDLGCAADALALIEGLERTQRALGRIRFAEARAALATGDLARCGALLEAGIEIPDVREGEVSLAQLWLDYQAQRLAAASGTQVTDEIRARAAREHPVPPHYDFGMHAAPHPHPHSPDTRSDQK